MPNEDTGEAPRKRGEFIGIQDRDEALFRIYPLWFLEEAFRLKQLVLVLPRLWEDPHEALTENLFIQTSQGQQPLGDGLRPAYAQSWSRTADSDTLLRAYSRVVRDPHFQRNLVPRDEGVRVRSSPAKLLRALLACCPQPCLGCCFIGSVRYMSQAELHQQIANAVSRIGQAGLASGRNRAQLLLMKRSMFQHEDEVRLIYVENRDVPGGDIVRVKIDPNEVFDEITFDPRLEVFERREREAMVRRLGYTGVIADSNAYERTILIVDLERRASPNVPDEESTRPDETNASRPDQRGTADFG